MDNPGFRSGLTTSDLRDFGKLFTEFPFLKNWETNGISFMIFLKRLNEIMM